MKRMWWTTCRAVLVGLMLVLMGAGDAAAADVASDFTLRDMNGQKVNLSDFKGQVILMSFWATWCGPCKVEMTHLNKLYEARKGDGFVVVSISSDDARSASQVKPYIRKMRYQFPVLLDRQSVVTSTYNPTKTLPYTVIIDRQFNIAKVHAGYNPGDEVEINHFVEGLLAAK